ncbi:MAG: acyl-CoA thioesterase [Neomegalonema sp.]|nr:acyl-CoA thioesterase [Neomegalonema sp.]
MAFEHEIRVAWGDCDPARIVYTARLPWFALDAINAWWEHHTGDGWYQMEIDRNVGTPFVRMEMNFRSPVTPRSPLRCKVWPNRLGQTSVGFHVAASQEGTACFDGDFVCVFTTADAFKKSPPPERLRKIIEEHLRASPATHQGSE